MKRRRYDAPKRALDILGAAFGAVLAAPLIAATALVVAVKLGRPVLFRQQRPGRDGRLFEILKFRTMLEPDPALGRETEAERMTPAGHRIRSLSLDELPSLWNVLKGDMSIVGPRPLMVSYLRRYSARQMRRHEVRPGLTGLAQVSGRNALPWDARLELDVQYVDNRSLPLDISILVRTVGKVLRRDGITEDGQATMSDFYGPMPTEVELVDLSSAALQDSAWSSSRLLREGIALSRLPNLQAAGSARRSAEAEPRGRDWVAVDRSGEPRAMCGFTGMTPSSANIYLYLIPDRRDGMVGREAMQLLIARALSLGLRQLWVEAAPENVEARRLFADLGFVELSMDSDDTIPMNLSLV